MFYLATGRKCKIRMNNIDRNIKNQGNKTFSPVTKDAQNIQLSFQ